MVASQVAKIFENLRLGRKKSGLLIKRKMCIFFSKPSGWLLVTKIVFRTNYPVKTEVKCVDSSQNLEIVVIRPRSFNFFSCYHANMLSLRLLYLLDAHVEIPSYENGVHWTKIIDFRAISFNTPINQTAAYFEKSHERYSTILIW